MNSFLIIKDENDGFGGAFQKSEIIAIAPCYDDEAMIYVHFRNGSCAKSFIGYEDYDSIVASIISEMGWS